MADESIFSFADEFGYESPFGNWLPDPPAQTAKIVSIAVEKKVSFVTRLIQTQKDTNTHFIVPIVVRISVSSPVSKVLITSGGESKTAANSYSGSLTYEAFFNVKFQKSLFVLIRAIQRSSNLKL